MASPTQVRRSHRKILDGDYFRCVQQFMDLQLSTHTALKHSSYVQKRNTSPEALAEFEEILNRSLPVNEGQKWIAATLQYLAGLHNRHAFMNYMHKTKMMGLSQCIDGKMITLSLGLENLTSITVEGGRYHISLMVDDPLMKSAAAQQPHGVEIDQKSHRGRGGKARRGGRGGGGHGGGRLPHSSSRAAQMPHGGRGRARRYSDGGRAETGQHPHPAAAAPVMSTDDVNKVLNKLTYETSSEAASEAASEATPDQKATPEPKTTPDRMKVAELPPDQKATPESGTTPEPKATPESGTTPEPKTSPVEAKPPNGGTTGATYKDALIKPTKSANVPVVVAAAKPAAAASSSAVKVADTAQEKTKDDKKGTASSKQAIAKPTPVKPTATTATVQAPAKTAPKAVPKAEAPAKPMPKAEAPAKPVPKAETPAKPTSKAEAPAKPTSKAEAPAKPVPKAETPAKPVPKAEAPAKAEEGAKKQLWADIADDEY